MALKLDISKAYDHVNWLYLKRRIQQMDFCSKWIQWMMLCVSTVQYNVCFNGSHIGPIIPRRGLRHWDPISLYLFLLCVDGLSNSLKKAEVNGEIHGCRICTKAPSVTHLLFADDRFLFFRENNHEVINVKEILNSYEGFVRPGD